MLNGQKTWVTAAPVADFFTVFAKAGEAKKLTIFLVERDFAGLAIGRKIDKMGVWALPTSELAFDDCFVPDSHRLSREEGDGEEHLRKTLAEIRIITGAMALGVARAALDEARALRRRAPAVRQADQPLPGDPDSSSPRWPPISRPPRTWSATPPGCKDSGAPHHKEAAMAKLFATEAAARICDQAARVLASYGYAMEYPVQRYLRDVRFTLIGGGTSEILKLDHRQGGDEHE